jgi:hypothetical protein
MAIQLIEKVEGTVDSVVSIEFVVGNAVEQVQRNCLCHPVRRESYQLETGPIGIGPIGRRGHSVVEDEQFAVLAYSDGHADGIEGDGACGK